MSSKQSIFYYLEGDNANSFDHWYRDVNDGNVSLSFDAAALADVQHDEQGVQLQLKPTSVLARVLQDERVVAALTAALADLGQKWA